MKLIKPIVKVGNSAGIVLPKEWYGGKAKVELIKKPLNIKRDIFEILGQYLDDIQGVYLVGSYARGEETEKSDVDVLVITNKINKRFEQGKYNIILVSQKQIENSLQNNLLPILPMLKEAKTLLNKDLILDYQKTPLTKKNLRFHIETTKSAMKMNKAAIELDKDCMSNTGDASAYSLILRLRSIYIVDCLKKNKKWSTKEFVNLTKKAAGSLNAYEGYLRVKSDKKMKEELIIEEAEKLYDYILKKIKEQEKWLVKRK